MKTTKTTNYEVKKENVKYYKMLEEIRRSGICNMWGSFSRFGKESKHLGRRRRNDSSRMDQ